MTPIKLMENNSFDGDDYVENSPSQVMDVNSKGFKAKKPPPPPKVEDKVNNFGGFKFDPKLGYIVDGEDPLLLISKGLSKEVVDELTKNNPKHAKPTNQARKPAPDPTDDLPPASRDAARRYGNL